MREALYSLVRDAARQHALEGLHSRGFGNKVFDNVWVVVRLRLDRRIEDNVKNHIYFSLHRIFPNG